MLYWIFTKLVWQSAILHLIDTNVSSVTTWQELVLIDQNQRLDIMRLTPEHAQLNPLLRAWVKLDRQDSRVNTGCINNAVLEIYS